MSFLYKQSRTILIWLGVLYHIEPFKQIAANTTSTINRKSVPFLKTRLDRFFKVIVGGHF
jgi:hypothetical protein